MASDNNGDFVQQRELNRLIDNVNELEKKIDNLSERLAATERNSLLLERLEIRIEKLDDRISKLLEQELPSVRMETYKLSNKTKIIWGLLVTVGSVAVSLITSVLRTLLGV